MRLGLPPLADTTSKRVPLWVASVRAVVRARPEVFFAKSFADDDLGTAQTLLAWRDALVDAGWDGSAIPTGGPRLDAIAAIESAAKQADEALPLGTGDRLVRACALLANERAPIYEALTLVEPRALWSVLWRRVFDLFERLGTRIAPLAIERPAASSASDLGRLQAHLRGQPATSVVEGDGSLVVLRGDTPTDLAELTAALLAKDPNRGESLVVRALDPAPLEAALERQHVATQGHAGASAWRPAMQILPLAVELAFAPRDPYRVLELLTLPHGPLQGLLGERLARAVARQPGIDGQEWRRQKEEAKARLRAFHLQNGKSETEADELVASRLARIAEWVEGECAGPEGATREALLQVGERVQAWLQVRVAGLGAVATGSADDAEERAKEARLRFGAAYRQASDFVAALRNHDRSHFTKEDARYLLDQLARGAAPHELTAERAGRVPYVTHPSALLAPRRTIVAWCFVAGTERAYRRAPWTASEHAALERAGVSLPDPKELLRVEADAWRRVVLMARERVVLVIPSSVQGEPKSPHPLWDEISARLDLDEAKTQRLTRTVADVLTSEEARLSSSALDVATEALVPLHLPEARGMWSVAPEALTVEAEATGTSATSLEKLATCPLSWVLEQRARLREGAIAKVASGPLLFGSLTHRLVEELHREDAFREGEDELVSRARAQFAELLEREGATLLLEGASFERMQLVEQVARAMRELHRYLATTGFRIAAVEEGIETDSAVGKLRGRLDVRLVDDQGRSAVLDLKWGASTYREMLEEGRAVQLAVYARAVTGATHRTSMAPAAYFALGAGKILAADERMKAARKLEGPTLDETLARVETTAKAVLESTARGRIYVAATRKALPLLEALGVPPTEHESHFTLEEREVACTYCAYDAICGRRWEVLS